MIIKPAKALISVYDKTGLVYFGKELAEMGIEIISTGGTAKRLQDAGINFQSVSSLTGFPEILGGRVKSLHPAIHGGILARRERKDDLQQLKEHQIDPVDLVVVNLYPFEKVLAEGGNVLKEYIEMIDIGGPTLLRAAAKNFQYVTVVTTPKDYQKIINELKQKGGITLSTRLEMARKAFARTAEYDQLIMDFLNSRISIEESPDHKLKVLPEKMFKSHMSFILKKEQDLRYGENPHQEAAYYSIAGENKRLTKRQLAGKPLSFNNLNDLDAAVNQVREFISPAVSIVKHTNPCGIGEDPESIKTAFLKALKSDPLSAFGGIVALNRKLDEETARAITENANFLEVLAAPDFESQAIDLLIKRWKNLRIIELPWLQDAKNSSENRFAFKQISGGFLVQEVDLIKNNKKDWKIVTKRKPDARQLKDLEFAWKVAKNVKSNAIVIARDSGTVGIGAGQMSRVDACKIAVEKGSGKLKDSVAASDAFFPFPDALETLAENGVTAIIQPGGSIRDDEVIRRADELGIAMVFTGERHFLH